MATSWSSRIPVLRLEGLTLGLVATFFILLVVQTNRVTEDIQSDLEDAAKDNAFRPLQTNYVRDHSYPHLYSIMEDKYSEWFSSPLISEPIIPVSERKIMSKIRYAALGSSMTWGSTLENREKEAYVRVLSKFGSNYGIRGSGPSYPAACLSSMFGEDQYDVVIVEFFTILNVNGRELLQRIRQRFPDALIVMAKFWNPTEFLVNNHKESMRSWAITHGYGQGYIHKAEFRKAFLDEVQQNQDKGWHWHWEADSKTQIEVAKEVGAYVIPMDWSPHLETMMNIGDRLLGYDSFHLGLEGHRDFANRVRALVERVGVPKEAKVEPFVVKDLCYNWFLTGVIGDRNSRDEGLFRYSDNAVIDKMPNTEKFAMTFGDDEEGWITMTNPSDSPMYLYVAYMVNGPAPSKYGEVKAERTDVETFSSESDEAVSYDMISNPQVLDPVAGWGSEIKQNVHVSKMISLGRVDKQQTAKVLFTPLSQEHEWPFRIVQLALTEIKNFNKAHGAMPDSGRLVGMDAP